MEQIIKAREVNPQDIILKDIHYDSLAREYGEFVYIVSHDLNAPLRHLKEFSQLLVNSLNEDINQDQKTYVSFINRSLQRLETMQQSLLDFSRINTLKKSNKVINSNFLVSRSLEQIAEKVDLTSFNISYSDLPNIYGDPILIGKLFFCLLKNATQYHFDDGQKNISIQSHEDESEIIFEITDNGIGIDSQFCEAVFTMFRRLHNQDEYGGGVGAGLTISKKIIENHGGNIWIESKVTMGTKVYFSLPKPNASTTVL